MNTFLEDKIHARHEATACMDHLLFPVGRGVSVKNAERIIESFVHTGRSHHSPVCTTLGIVLRYCERNSISYKLTKDPNLGAFIERLESTVP